MPRALAILGLITTLAIILYCRDAAERRWADRGCRSEGFVLATTDAGYRCRDRNGTLFLPPFKPERHR